MRFQEFARQVQERVGIILGDGCSVSLNKVKKNNNVYLTGLTIRDIRYNLFPTLYLENFYESYKEGKSIERICNKIVDIYQRDTIHDNLDFSFYTEFEKVKDRICYKLIGVDRNIELLKEIPHIVYMDMAICFFYAFENCKMGHGTVLIQNSHMEMWGTTTEMLLKLAQENTPRIYPASLCSMNGILMRLMEDTDDEEERAFMSGLDASQIPMQILSNKNVGFGAACMIYPDLLKNISERQHKDFYILPSSVHEVILLADDGGQSPENLAAMVREINATQVEAEEVLSDSIYYYGRKDKIIRRLL